VELDVSSNNIGALGCSVLASHLSNRVCRIRKLRVAENNLGDKGKMVYYI
jgi:hypothetical protein